MTTPTFTVLIGSANRASLRQSLDSIARQAHVPGDQCIIAFDALEKTSDELERAITLVKSYGDGFEACAYNSGYHWLGVEQINHALRTMPITGSHVFTIGDDDVFVDGAYEALRPFCAQYPLRPILYRFIAPNRWILWDKPRMSPCLISGCCIAAPYPFVREMHTRIETTHDYDWMIDIIRQAKLMAGTDPLWLDYVGVIARPDRYRDDVMHQPIWRCWNCPRWGHRELTPITKTHCLCGAPFLLQEVYSPRVVVPASDDSVNHDILRVWAEAHV